MDTHYTTIDEPATPDYVLAVIRDAHRLQCQYDSEADPDAVLSFESTVAEWREACDLVGWRELGRALNDLWSIRCSDAEWLSVLEPADQKRLADVCELVARHAVRPRIRSARLFGRVCGPAGAFLTVRSLLREAGADVRELAPSTPLASYTRGYPSVFLDRVSRLAPGALPAVRIHSPVYDAAILSFLPGTVALLIGACSGLPVLTVMGLLTYAMSYLLARVARPASVDFEGLITFRDLANAIADGT